MSLSQGCPVCHSRTPSQGSPNLGRTSRTIRRCENTNLFIWKVFFNHCMLPRSVCYLGDSFREGMWQARWKTLGHLSQHSSSPPFWQTAHQSSLGSSSCSFFFSDSGCDWVWGLSFLESDAGTATVATPFCWSLGFDWAPVLLSGRLDPTLDCTYRQQKYNTEIVKQKKVNYGGFHIATHVLNCISCCI